MASVLLTLAKMSQPAPFTLLHPSLWLDSQGIEPSQMKWLREKTDSDNPGDTYHLCYTHLHSPPTPTTYPHHLHKSPREPLSSFTWILDSTLVSGSCETRGW
ncbi:hypothetical protein Pcinc_021491 [Petrolisthes cinctipes]|uniref:Uncharacterized protein n=1 Tax=Petrolisthes cinctipes TaxID=88211 RepID=A0AAE1FGA1_PETCI|nr:hypothetical protein Pcinc_021491 [Petrolisthes cinctipes]